MMMTALISHKTATRKSATDNMNIGCTWWEGWERSGRGWEKDGRGGVGWLCG